MMVIDFQFEWGKYFYDRILKTVPEGIDTSSFRFIVTFRIKFFEDINLPNKPLVRHHRFFCVLLYVLFSLKIFMSSIANVDPSPFMNGHE